MGLFSNLFGDAGKDIDGALGKMKDLADDLASVKYADEDEKRLMNNQPASAESGSFSATFTEEGPSGDSWGPTMPAEPNQFNSGLNFKDYFANIYKTEFPSYQVEQEKAGWSDVYFTFYQDGNKKLVVELMSETCNRTKFTKECRQQGIPYLRFYHNHEGWWNTKSYVIRRTSAALGI